MRHTITTLYARHCDTALALFAVICAAAGVLVAV